MNLRETCFECFERIETLAFLIKIIEYPHNKLICTCKKCPPILRRLVLNSIGWYKQNYNLLELENLKLYNPIIAHLTNEPLKTLSNGECPLQLIDKWWHHRMIFPIVINVEKKKTDHYSSHVLPDEYLKKITWIAKKADDKKLIYAIMNVITKVKFILPSIHMLKRILPIGITPERELVYQYYKKYTLLSTLSYIHHLKTEKKISKIFVRIRPLFDCIQVLERHDFFLRTITLKDVFTFCSFINQSKENVRSGNEEKKISVFVDPQNIQVFKFIPKEEQNDSQQWYYFVDFVVELRDFLINYNLPFSLEHLNLIAGLKGKQLTSIELFCLIDLILMRELELD